MSLRNGLSDFSRIVGINFAGPRNVGLSIDLEIAVLELDDEDPPEEAPIAFFPPSDGFDEADDACIAWSVAGFCSWDDSPSSIDDGFRFFDIIYLNHRYQRK